MEEKVCVRWQGRITVHEDPGLRSDKILYISIFFFLLKLTHSIPDYRWRLREVLTKLGFSPKVTLSYPKAPHLYLAISLLYILEPFFNERINMNIYSGISKPVVSLSDKYPTLTQGSFEAYVLPRLVSKLNSKSL